MNGLAAKNIIDIDIVYNTDLDFEKIKTTLEDLGYFHNGNQEVEGREVFKRNNRKYIAVLDEIPHHLYVCKTDNVELEKHLLFRNYLRQNETAKAFYSQLKTNIATEANQNKKDYACLKEVKAGAFIHYIITLSKLEKTYKKNK